MSFGVTFVSQPFDVEGVAMCHVCSFVVEGHTSTPGAELLNEEFPTYSPWAVIAGGISTEEPTPVEDLVFTLEEAATYWPPEGSERFAA